MWKALARIHFSKSSLSQKFFLLKNVKNCSLKSITLIFSLFISSESFTISLVSLVCLEFAEDGHFSKAILL
jgi:hypothetical protein